MAGLHPACRPAPKFINALKPVRSRQPPAAATALVQVHLMHTHHQQNNWLVAVQVAQIKAANGEKVKATICISAGHCVMCVGYQFMCVGHRRVVG